MSAEKLYTPALLAAAVELAAWPPMPDAALQGHARAPACGSTIAMDIDCDDDGRIARIGMLVRACAVGQASAAIFGRHAPGLGRDDIAKAAQDMQSWLTDGGPLPDWPGLDLIEPAREFPGRHGAIMLPWNAALAALSTAPATG